MKNFTFSMFFLFGMALCCLPQISFAQCMAGETLDTYCYGQGEVDVVGIEVCPTAGMAIQSTIVQGTINFGGNNVTVYSGNSGSGASGTIVLVSSSGDVSGNTLTSLAADQCLSFVFNTFPGVPLTCAEAFDPIFQVCSQSVAIASVTLNIMPDEFCSNDGNQTLGGGLPTGGVYSGTGVTDDVNGTSFTFDPSAGSSTVTYTNGSSAMDGITVSTAGTTTMNVSLTERCIDQGSIVLAGNVSPTGGAFSGDGVTDNGDGINFTFDPTATGLGMATITYTGPDPCNDVVTDMIDVTAACACTSGQTSHFYCQGNNEMNAVAFEVCPSFGFAAQANINSGSFNAFVMDGDQLNVYSGASGSGTSGTLVSGPLTGDLSGQTIMGSVADDCLIFVVTTGAFGSCQDGFETALSVCGVDIAPTVTFIDPGDFCLTDGVQTLSGGLPTGGEYSGAGVTDDDNGETFTFNPANAGVGPHTLTYTLGVESDDVMIEVFASGLVSFTAPNDICIDAGIQVNLGGGSPAGGSYSGPGVEDNGNGTYDFNPAIAGLGIHTISYMESTGCMETALDQIEVLAACGCPNGEQSFFHCADNNESNLVLFELCPTDPSTAIRATIDQGTYSSTFADGDVLTVYSGLSGSGTGGTVVFGPMGGDLSGTVIESLNANECLTFVSTTGPVGSCLSDGAELALQGCASDVPPPTNFTAPDDICVNAGVQMGLSGGTPEGGVYSGNIGGAVIDGGDGVTYSINPAAGPGTLTITYTANGDPASDDVELIATPDVTYSAPDDDLCLNAGLQSGLTGGTPLGGTYSSEPAGLVIDAGDGEFYSIDPSNGADSYTITYTYTDPVTNCTNTASDDITILSLPVVDYTAPADLCVNVGIQSGLTGGTPLGGTYSSDPAGLVMDAGDGEFYSIDPSAGAGTYTIIYTYTDGDGGEDTDSEIACTNTASDDIVILDLPMVAFDAIEQICIEAGTQTDLGGGTPQGGTYSSMTAGAVMDNSEGETFTFDPMAAGVGPVTVTYTYPDPVTGCVNTASDVIMVIMDSNPPVITGTLMAIDQEGCTADDAPDPVTSVAALEGLGLMIEDDCSADEDITVAANDASSGSCPIVIIRTYTLTDETGKTSMTTQTINIDDETAPVASCQTYTLLLDANGEGTLLAENIDGGSSDNCNGTLSFALSQEDFNCSNLGANPVTLTVTDACDNAAPCSTTVTVELSGDLPNGWSTTDIGLTTIGNEYFFDPCVSTNPEDGEFTITGSGNNATSSTTDNIAFASTTICGDGSITAKIESVEPNGYGGLMIRETTDAGSKQVAIFSNMSNSLRHETRSVTNAPKQVQSFVKPAPFWLRLERAGDWVFAYYSTTGVNFTYVHAVFVPMQSCIEIGLASFTFLPNAQNAAVFSNVEVVGTGVLIGGGDTFTQAKQTTESNIQLYPNPTDDYFTVYIGKPQDKTVQLSLYNIMGQLIEVQQIQAGVTQLEWNTSNLEVGTYLLKIDNEEMATQTKRIIVAR